jgi:hypothetical protein
VFEGSGTFRDSSEPVAVRTEQVGTAGAAPAPDAQNRSLVLFDTGDEITVQAGPEGIRFLLVSGRPLKELSEEKRSNLLAALGASLGILLVGLLFAFIVGTVLARPLMA